jgi:hypothetical protein
MLLIERYHRHSQWHPDVSGPEHAATQLRVPASKPRLGRTWSPLPGAGHRSPARTNTASGSTATSGPTDQGSARTSNNCRCVVRGHRIRVLRAR